jgi:hypothetical protein
VVPARILAPALALPLLVGVAASPVAAAPAHRTSAAAAQRAASSAATDLSG